MSVQPEPGSYFCPTSGAIEHSTRGGFDICCDRPDLHWKLAELVGESDRQPGVWLAYHSDMSGVVPFATEIDALRYAIQWSMQVKHVRYGDAEWRHREDSAGSQENAGRRPCYCGHIAARHEHRLECAAVDCDCTSFRELHPLT